MLLQAQTLKMESRVLLIDASSNEVDRIAESAGLVSWQTPQQHHAGKQLLVTCEAPLRYVGMFPEDVLHSYTPTPEPLVCPPEHVAMSDFSFER